MAEVGKLKSLREDLAEVPLEGAEAVETRFVVIEWRDTKGRPRVLPPIIRARAGELLRFYYKDPGKARIILPRRVHGGAVPMIDNTDDLGGPFVDVRTDPRGRSRADHYLEYRVEVEAPSGERMLAVGNSPPGMVLGDDPGTRGGP